MSQRLQRLSDTTYAIVDSELAIVATEASCFASPCLVGIAFKTAQSGWRALDRGIADCGHLPDQQHAIDRLLERAAQHPVVPPRIDLPAGFAEARATLRAGGDVGHRTALHLLQCTIEIVDALLEARRDLPEAVRKAVVL